MIRPSPPAPAWTVLLSCVCVGVSASLSSSPHLHGGRPWLLAWVPPLAGSLIILSLCCRWREVRSSELGPVPRPPSPRHVLLERQAVLSQEVRGHPSDEGPHILTASQVAIASGDDLKYSWVETYHTASENQTPFSTYVLVTFLDERSN